VATRGRKPPDATTDATTDAPETEESSKGPDLLLDHLDALRVLRANDDSERDAILTQIGGSLPTNVVGGYLLSDVNLDGQVKYTGVANDRDRVLLTIGGSIPTAVRNEQLP